MPHYSDNKCTNCGNHCSKELLTIRKVIFTARTQPSKVLKSRTTDWLCEECRDEDPDWNRKAFDAPGHTSPALERARKISGS